MLLGSYPHPGRVKSRPASGYPKQSSVVPDADRPPVTLPPSRTEWPALVKTAPPSELSFAQIVQSINREVSNDGTHETKPPSYGAGEWGRNRVRIFPDPKTSNFQIEWRENGRRVTRSLGNRDWVRAKREADEFAAGIVGPEIGGKAEAEPSRSRWARILTATARR